MSKYDFARRLKRIIHEECELAEAESKIAKKSAKYYEQITSLKSMLVRQEQELSKYRKNVEDLKRENDQLEKYNKLEEDRLVDLKQKVEQLQVEYHQTLQMQIEQRRTALLYINCIRNMKLATQTYINLKALPRFIQGLTIKETESSSDWKPFCIDPTKHTQQEVQDMIWNDPRVDSVHKEAWEALILSDILRDANSNLKEMETESGNVTVTMK